MFYLLYWISLLRAAELNRDIQQRYTMLVFFFILFSLNRCPICLRPNFPHMFHCIAVAHASLTLSLHTR